MESLKLEISYFRIQIQFQSVYNITLWIDPVSESVFAHSLHSENSTWNLNHEQDIEIAFRWMCDLSALMQVK